MIEHMHSSGGYSPEDFLRVENGGGGSTVVVPPAAPTAPSPPPPPSPAYVPAAADSEGVWSEADFLPPGEFQVCPFTFCFRFLCSNQTQYRTQRKNKKLYFLTCDTYQMMWGSNNTIPGFTSLISCPNPPFEASFLGTKN